MQEVHNTEIITLKLNKMSISKKSKQSVNWVFDAGFWSQRIMVKAKTKGEARKKAMAKLSRMPISRMINKNTTFLDKY